MKKWTKLLTVPATLAVLAACGNGGTTEEQPAQDTTEETVEAPTDTTEETTDMTEDTTEDTTETAEETTEDETDATTGASRVTNEEELATAFEEGPWIVLLEDDIEATEALTMAGGFTNDDGEPERKIGLYSQDEDGEVAETYTLTAPSITIENEYTRVVNGTVESDFTVEAEEFTLEADTTIDGNVDFSTQEYYDSASLDEGTVTGEITVAGEAVEDAQ